jgi:hypothetical protein
MRVRYSLVSDKISPVGKRAMPMSCDIVVSPSAGRLGELLTANARHGCVLRPRFFF